MLDFDRKIAAAERIFPKLDAYGRSIEAGQDPFHELLDLQSEMLKRPEEVLYAIGEAIGFQEMLAKATASGGIKADDIRRAPERLDRLHKLRASLHRYGAEPTTGTVVPIATFEQP